MRWRLFFIFSILVFGFSAFVFAISEKDIVFPVAELGNCKNKTECKAYCQQKEHIDACIAFAKSHQLISQEEASRAQRFKDVLKDGGPGGCKNFDECKTYCENSDHHSECIEFATSHGLMEEREVKDANRVLELLKKGEKLPGGCTAKERCEAYCREEEHMDECIEFGHRAGFMNDKDYEIAKKTHGKGPGGCRGQECQEYCQAEEHVDECLAFAKDHGFISEKDAQMAQKTHGKGPGGCRGKECEEFCRKPENQDTCIQFAKEHGFISEEEYQRIKEHHGISQQGGPGGCRGEECRNYCEKPEHKDECVKFAKDQGFMKEGAQSEGEHQQEKPLLREEVIACLKETLGVEEADKFINAKETKPLLPAKARQCFEMMRSHESPESQGEGATSPKHLENPFGKGAGNPHPAQLPPDVLVCLRDHASPETLVKVKNGKSADLTPDEKKIVMECFNTSKGQGKNLPSSQNLSGSTSRGNHENAEDRQMCPQVMTPAKNPENGRCSNFPTPCVVPPQWVKVDKCEMDTSREAFCKEHPEACARSIPSAPPSLPFIQPPKEPSGTLEHFGATLLRAFYFLSGKR